MEVLWSAISRYETVRDSIQEARVMVSLAYPPAWYLLWLVIAVCGVGTWFLRNFTERVEATRLVAFTGVTSMSAMVIWTFTQF